MAPHPPSLLPCAQVPETRGKTLEQITADLGSSSPPTLPGARVSGGKDGPRHVPLAGSDDDEEEEAH